MLKNSFALSFFFLFLFLSVPAFAVMITVDYNVSASTSTNAHYIQCINASSDSNIYCYILNANSGSPNWWTKLERYNSTLGDRKECAIETSAIGNNVMGMAIIDEDTMLYDWGDAYCEYWNISDIANGNCALLNSTGHAQCSEMTSGVTNGWDYSNGLIYSIRNQKMVNAGNLSKSSVGFWNSTYNFGWGTYQMYLASLPNASDNTTLYIAGLPHTYVNYKASKILRYDGGVLTDVIDDFYTVFGINSTYNYTYFDVIKLADGSSHIYLFNRDLARVYRANWTVNDTYSMACDWTTEPVGISCVSGTEDLWVNNSDNCHLAYGSCGTNGRCVPLTPQYNASYGWTTNIADCSHCYFLQQYYSSNSSWVTIRSNCMNALQCANETLSTYNPTPYAFRVIAGYNGVYHFNQTIPQGVTASIPDYTIYCQNKTDGSLMYIVTQFSNNTTEARLIYDETGLNITINATYQNTSTQCFDSSGNTIPCYTGSDQMVGLKQWLNAGMGSPFGSDIISLIVSAALSIWVFMLAQDKKIELLFGPFMVVASAFSFVGLLTSWFLVMEGAIIFVMVFWKVKGG